MLFPIIELLVSIQNNCNPDVSNKIPDKQKQNRKIFNCQGNYTKLNAMLRPIVTYDDEIR